MGLLGENWDDPKTLATLQLAAGLLGPGSFGQNASRGLLGYQQSLGAAEDRETQKQYRAAQSKALAGEDELRQEKIRQMRLQQQQDAAFYGGGSAVGAPARMGGVVAQTASDGGAMPQITAQGISEKFGIPIEEVLTSYKSGGTKGLAEAIQLRTKPNWVTSNGNTFNTNAPGFQPGLQDGYQLGPDGRSTVFRANGGNPVMGAVPGSLEAYGAFQGINQRTNAAYTPGRPTIGEDGRMYPQSQLQEVGGGASASPLIGRPPVGATGPTNPAERGMANQVADVPYDAQREIASVTRDLQAGNLSPQDRANAVAYLAQLQGGRTQMLPQAQPAARTGALDFSPQEKAQQEANRVKQVEQAKADVEPTRTRAAALETSGDALRSIDSVLQHPGLKTATGLNGMVDPRNYIPGTDAKNFQVALDQIKGGVFLEAYKDLRGSGAITDIEGSKAEQAKARINRAQSPEEFVSGLRDYRAIVQRGIDNIKAREVGDGRPSSAAQASTGKATLRFNPSTGKLEAVK